ncbi:MAG TPA: Uma2 family endonuclease [Bryobacteraceae bacterium]|jgi:Uma2 family endonuclease
MSAAVQVSLAEYLSTEYEPDCDYVDGILEERNVGLRRHSRTQTLLALWLGVREKEHGQRVLVEQRVRVSPSRIRIPDVCLVSPDNNDELTQRPPTLWIEVLSPDDRWSRVQVRLNDCLRFGVEMIWIIDPYSKQAWIATQASGTMPVEDETLRCAKLNLEVGISEILPED